MDKFMKEEFIDDIVRVLNELNNYDFCFFLKKKYNISEFNYNNISRIIENREGINYLLDFLNTMKDNKQLCYLNEILVFNPQCYKDMNEKIIPKLNKLSKDNEKNRDR